MSKIQKRKQKQHFHRFYRKKKNLKKSLETCVNIFLLIETELDMKHITNGLPQI